MARWLSTLTIYAGCFAFLASAASAQPVTGHTNDDIFDSPTTTIVSVAEGSVGNSSSSIGQMPGSPLFSEFFEFESGVPVQFTLTFEPGSFGGVVVFGIGKSDNVNMGTAEPFNSLLIRTNADLAGTRIDITNLVLGPPPSLGGGGNLVFETASPGTLASSRAIGAMGLDVLKISEVDFAAGFTLQGNLTATFDVQNPPTGDELMGRIYLAGTPDFPDADGDGVEDGEDNCPNAANLNQDDDDLDGLGDACDNCPLDPNSQTLGTCGAGQIGLVCTSNAACDTEPGAQDGACVLGQADGDEDGSGDVCDNCNVGCTTLNPVSPTCSNRNQADGDDDGVGDLCDNCIAKPNGPFLGTCIGGTSGIPCTSDDECDTEFGAGDGVCSQNQENSDGDADGDACLDSLVGFEVEGTPAGATAPGEATFGLTEIPSPAPPSGDVVYASTLDCGSQNVSAANIGFLMPDTNSVFGNFAGCTTSTNNGTCDTTVGTCTAGSIGANCTADADCDNEFDCSLAPWESEAGVLGNTVAKASITVGPNITDPTPGAGDDDVPPTLVILQLTGNIDSPAFDDDLLCEAFDPTNNGTCDTTAGTCTVGTVGAACSKDADCELPNQNKVTLGPITVSNLPEDSSIVISQLGFESLGLSLLVDAENMSVPATAIQTSVDASGDLPQLVTMEVGPAIDDMGLGRRFVVKMTAVDEDVISGIAFGLRGPPGILANQMKFGNCTTDATVDGIVGNSCAANADLGASVEVTGAGINPDAFTVDPNSGNPLFPDNTLMVGVWGNRLDGGSLNPALNVPEEDANGNEDLTDDPVVIGRIEYINLPAGFPPQAPPSIDFQGAIDMPGFDTGAIQPDFLGRAIEPLQVGRVVGGNADSDQDSDGRGDNLDNCPYVQNTFQENQGGVRLAMNEVDFVGDVCQCGDSGTDGEVDDGFDTDQDDVEECQALLAGAGDLPGETPEERARRFERCSVTGGVEPSIIDLVVLELELDTDPTVSAGTPIEQVCDPARQ